MKVTGMRALLASRAAMEEAGYGQKQPSQDPEGWIRPNYANSLGYGLRKCPDGDLEWNLTLSGDDLVRWRSYEQRRGDDEDGDTVEMHEPENDDRLHAPIRRVFEGLGLDVAAVRTSGWGGHWDRDISYIVTTRHPDWLEAYDPQNRPQAAAGPVLTGYAMRRDSRGQQPVRGALPGYAIDGKPHLTRESVRALAEATAGTWGIAYALDGDGSLSVSRDNHRVSRSMPVTHVNHWGDTVETWPVPPLNFEQTPLVRAAVPVLVDGEMRTTIPFALIDAQYGEAPWTKAEAPHRP